MLNFFRFQPLKLLFSRKYPVVAQYSDEQKADRIYRLMQSEEGQVLALMIAEEIDKLQDYASDEAVVVHTNKIIHANGGIYALRGLYQKLQGMMAAQIALKAKENKRLQKTTT